MVPCFQILCLVLGTLTVNHRPAFCNTLPEPDKH